MIGTRLVATAATACALWLASALLDPGGTVLAQGGTHPLYLPFAVAPARPVPCGPARIDPCAASQGVGGFITHCGGMGRIRDLVAIPASGDILAIGDGAATVSLGASGTEWLTAAQLWSENGPSGAARRDALGIVGLNGLYVLPACRGGGAPCGWAVGERGQILDLDVGSSGSAGAGGAACWDRHDAWPVDNTAIDLNSIFAFAPSGRNPVGWIVGRADEHAEIMVLASRGAEPVWERETGLDTGGTPMPPLLDVQTLDGTRAIALGHDGRDGVFADLELIGLELDRVRAAVTDRVAGLPEQIALTPDGAPGGIAVPGWAFGRADASGAATRIWELSPGGWFQSSPDRPQGLIDAFSTRAFGQWLGLLGREPGDAVLSSLAGDGLGVDWETRMRAGGVWGGPSPTEPGSEPGDAGHMAILPIDAGRVIYAAGDDIWLADVDEARWSHLQTRRRLVGFAPNGRGGGWALAAEAGGSRLLELLPSGPTRLVDAAEAADAGTRLPPLNAIASGGGQTWAVGPDGESWRAFGPRAAWRRASPATAGPGSGSEAVAEPPTGPAVDLLDVAGPSDDLLDVAVTDGGAAWASGVGADGRGRLWRWVEADGSWAEVARLDGRLALRAVAAFDDGAGVERVVAVGGETILFALPDDECGPGAGHWRGPAGWMCTEALAFDLPAGALDFVDVAATSVDSIWAAGRDHLVRLRTGGDHRVPGDWRADVPPGMPAGGRPVAVALVGPGDGILVHSCCEGFVPAERRPSNIRRYRVDAGDALVPVGPAAVVNVPLSAAVVERRPEVGTGADPRARAGEGPVTGTGASDPVRVWLAGDWTTLIEASYPLSAAPEDTGGAARDRERASRPRGRTSPSAGW